MQHFVNVLKRIRLGLAAVIASLTLTTLPTVALASLRAVADDQLARTSAAAVQGRVVAVSSQWDADTIYTFVTIDVVKAWGLGDTPARVVVKQLGGVVGPTALRIGGQATFAVGEDVLVFLDVRPRDNTLSVAGLEQGKWLLTGSADAATSALRETHGPDDATIARDFRSARDLDALASLAGSRVSAAGAVLQPALPVTAAADSYGVNGFTYLTSQPARWHEADSATPVYVDTQAGGHPQFAGGGLSQLANAAAIWRAAGSLPLTPGVARSARCFYNSENDHRLSVTYGDPCGEISDASSTIAIGGAYYSSSDQRVVNGVNFWKITKGMIVVDNPPQKFASFSTGCYEEMLVHELGHAIGFGHAAARPAIMYPSISSACFGRAASAPLGADDRAGMAALYPGASAGPGPGAPTLMPPGAPSGLVGSATGSTVTIRWSAPTSGGSATSYTLVAGTAPGASNIGAIPVNGTALVVPGVPNGTYYVRVVATNGVGASAPTADVAIVVGGAAAIPAAPRNVVATAPAPGVVNIGWQAPASGPAPTSYVLIAGYVSGANTFQIPVNGPGLAGGGVPAGTYYLRVVALNGGTPGPASPEVVLVVR